MIRGAELSDDGLYRYQLHRRWKPLGGLATFVMLNPSTADALRDDQTVRRCVRFAMDWGCAGLNVYNLYALRSTDPAALWSGPVDPVGPDNDDWLRLAVIDRKGGPFVVAWGNGPRDPRHHARLAHVEPILRLAYPVCLGVTASGQPRHPSRLSRTAERYHWAMPERTRP